MHVLEVILGELKRLRGHVGDIFSYKFAEANLGFGYLLHES